MLSDRTFRVVYTSGDEEPTDFFYDALCNSITFDLGLGFFHSSGFQALAFGFAKFILVGGSMRIIINDQLEPEDKEAIERGIVTDPHLLIEERIIKNFDSLFRTLHERDKHFFNCLSWLVATKKLEMKAVVPKHSNQGIAHQKYGIFRDLKGNRLAFNGSANFSYNAMKNNLETITAFKSWTNEGSEVARVDYYESIFERMWVGSYQGAMTIPLEKVKTIIRKRFEPTSVDKLQSDEEELLESAKRTDGGLKLGPIGGFEEQPTINKLVPHFPFPGGPRPYQKEAYENWLSHKCSGIFAMATGTGKTVTSLNCLLEEYRKLGAYYLLVLVPTLTLVEQWKKEIAGFSLENVFEVSGVGDWRTDLTRLKNRLMSGVRDSFVILSTYQSFVNPVVQSLLREIEVHTNHEMILIADEAHNIGAPSVKAVFDHLTIAKRIALSATPKREYDPEGTQAIEKYFDDKPPYCYNFSLERAISEDFLCKYYYYPHIVKLNKDEFDEYQKISQRLLMFFDSKSGRLKDDQNVARLLIQRKRIIHKAEDKSHRLIEICKSIGSENLQYCFVYAPEGEDDQAAISIIEKMKLAMSRTFPEINLNEITSKVSLADRADILRGFSEGRIDVLFAMKILDEGVDIPRAQIGIFASSAANPRQFIQRRGRLLRTHPQKSVARIYDMVVVPDYFSPDYDPKFKSLERSLVKSELTRVGYFASLALNFADSRQSLQEVTDFYNLSLDTIINELKNG
jgi:superfamily II DNA or RNA helicase